MFCAVCWIPCPVLKGGDTHCPAGEDHCHQGLLYSLPSCTHLSNVHVTVRTQGFCTTQCLDSDFLLYVPQSSIHSQTSTFFYALVLSETSCTRILRSRTARDPTNSGFNVVAVLYTCCYSNICKPTGTHLLQGKQKCHTYAPYCSKYVT